MISGGRGLPQSARDQRVTRPMPPTSPYDHTAHRMTPNSYSPPLPLRHLYAQTPGYTHRTPDSPPAVWQHGHPGVPRGFCGQGNGIYYDRVRDLHHSTLYHIPPPQSPYLQPLNAVSPVLYAYRPNQSRPMIAQHRMACFPADPNPLMAWEKAYARPPTPPLELYHGAEDYMPRLKPGTEAWANVKGSGWHLRTTRKKKRRTGELFNKDFGFHAAIIRRPSRQSPEISPRTSISCQNTVFKQVLVEKETEDSVKRQRIDSKVAGTVPSLPFGEPEPMASMRGCDLGSPAMSPRASVAYSTPLGGTTTREEVHPGTLVDWSRPCTCLAMDGNNRVAAEERRRGSLPSVFSASTSGRKRSKIIALLARAQVFDASSKTLAPSQVDAPHKEREELYTIGRRRSTDADGDVEMISMQSGHEDEDEDAYTCGDGDGGGDEDTDSAVPSLLSSLLSSIPVLKRATSDPSTDAFLRHVRASLEIRRRKDAREKGKAVVDYPVFADEAEKGFLDDAPL